MEDVIETYMRPLDAENPVVCFDESPVQLLHEVREPIDVAPGRPRREDCEYERCGVVEAMMICQPAAGLRKCLVTEHRRKPDFAGVCKELDRMFPKAQTITLVCDNLNTHTKGALYATFPAEERADWPKRSRSNTRPSMDRGSTLLNWSLLSWAGRSSRSESRTRNNCSVNSMPSAQRGTLRPYPFAGNST